MPASPRPSLESGPKSPELPPRAHVPPPTTTFDAASSSTHLLPPTSPPPPPPPPPPPRTPTPPTRKPRRWWWQLPRFKHLQNRLVTLAIASVLLLIVILIYIVLVVSRLKLGQEWHVLLVLIVLITTLFFCHSLSRLVIDLATSRQERFSRVPSIAGPEGWACPREPIRINTQGPAEAGEGLKEPPPVYGLWRCSVRVNPEQFFWQRTGVGAEEQQGSGGVQGRRSLSSPRPPSYISDDGVTYALQPTQRGSVMLQLPPHPAEVNRLQV